jgi:hypothetical protein
MTGYHLTEGKLWEVKLRLITGHWITVYTGLDAVKAHNEFCDCIASGRPCWIGKYDIEGNYTSIVEQRNE